MSEDTLPGPALNLAVVLAPDPYPLPPMAPEIWQNLPYFDNTLVSAAQTAYGCAHVLPVSGAEAGIAALARLFQTWYGSMRVVLAEPSFEAWGDRLRRANHVVLDWPAEMIAEGEIPECDVVIVGRPVNPVGPVIGVDPLLKLATKCREQGGWLVVDETFVDAEPIESFSAYAEKAPAIVLRSISPFFGLGGARVGFICAPQAVVKALNGEVGPWAVSGPALWAASVALKDSAWQAEQKIRLHAHSRRLAELWRNIGLQCHPTGLYLGLSGVATKAVYQKLLQLGIKTRLFDLDEPLLRCSMPVCEQDWLSLDHALQVVCEQNAVLSTR
ncbi:MAG: aminotransferase class I/II-fold pyridoxal phosphate-dependent enzyme [Burkholderiaceae bacterium]